MPKRRTIIEEIKDVLEAQDFVEFALLFGSFARGRQTPLSDVDIGIYLSRPVDLLTLGRLIAELERITGRSVDALVLNDLPARNPDIAYQAISSGEIITCKDPSAYVSFKTRAILRYLDTAYLRDMVSRAFMERLRNNRFGERSHA
ncbi:nucleotidyltransferase domain-containing protein [Candidatus Poribacteria bacterium]|nr:nucleotidyltransferase domain-containing protein [Candidatus Poribacteria bacterium]